MPKSVAVRFKIKLGNKPESLSRQVLFWDAGGMAHLQANIKAKVISPIALELNSIQIKADAKVTKSIKVRAIDERFDLQKLEMTVLASEVASQRFEASDARAGKLVLELDPKLALDDATQTELVIETKMKGTTICQQSVFVFYTHRSTTIPKQPTFQRDGNTYRSQIVVRSSGLVQALQDNQTIKAFAISSKDGKENRIPLVVDVSKSLPDSALSKLAISLRTEDRPTRFAADKLLLECGDWQHTFECQISN
jgi:hypothetical protein